MSKIMDILSAGKENALTAQDIGRLLGYDIRGVRSEIARLRQQGEFICATSSKENKGYFLPESDTDIVNFVVMTENRIKETQKMVQPAKDYVESKRGQ